MEKIKEYKGIIIIVLVILGLAFYWFQVRPAKIIKRCIEAYPKAFDNMSSGFISYRANISDKSHYDKCLREWGLVK